MQGATDPTDVHPEYDHPTPDNIDEWSDAQIEAYNDAKSDEHEQAVAERQRELSKEQKETLSLIESATDKTDVPTQEVELGDATVTVKCRVSGELEQKIGKIQEANNVGEIGPTLIDAITMVIVDDEEPDDDPYTFTDRETWEAYYARNGSEGLMDVFDIVGEPARQRMEQLRFRGGE